MCDDHSQCPVCHEYPTAFSKPDGKRRLMSIRYCEHCKDGVVFFHKDIHAAWGGCAALWAKRCARLGQQELPLAPSTQATTETEG